MEAQKKRSLVLIGIAVVLFGATAYMLFARVADEPIPTEYAINGVCLSCKRDVSAKGSVYEGPPYECSQCKQKAVYQWMYCPKCHRRVIPELVRPTDGRPPHIPPFARCKGCGNASIEAYVPDMAGQKPKGDVPLPKWP